MYSIVKGMREFHKGKQDQKRKMVRDEREKLSLQKKNTDRLR